MSRETISEEEFSEHRLFKAGPSLDVRGKYSSLLWRQPNVRDVSTGFLRDGKGGWTATWGITVWVTEKVDQSALPPEDRIPDHLEGVPVQIVEEEPLPRAPKTVCDYDTCRANSLAEEGSMTATPESKDTFRKRRHEVRLKYDPLFWRQPNVHGVGEGTFRDENGELMRQSGIVVSVTRKVEQSTLPPEYRIPDCLEGIPVQIEESEEAELAMLPRVSREKK